MKDELIFIIEASFGVDDSRLTIFRRDFNICDGYGLSCISCSVRDGHWTSLKDWVYGCEGALDLGFGVLGEVVISVLECIRLFGWGGFPYS